MGCSKSSSKREVYSNTILPQDTRKVSTKQPNLTLKAIRERRTKNPTVSRRKEVIKIRSEINEKEMKETIAKINKTESWFYEKINKIDKPLVRPTKKIREKTQIKRIRNGASLVVQWLRVCLPMQGTWVRALLWEDPTCRRATRFVSHNY